VGVWQAGFVNHLTGSRLIFAKAYNYDAPPEELPTFYYWGVYDALGHFVTGAGSPYGDGFKIEKHISAAEPASFGLLVLAMILLVGFGRRQCWEIAEK
jgi:hypothetical protein